MPMNFPSDACVVVNEIKVFNEFECFYVYQVKNPTRSVT